MDAISYSRALNPQPNNAQNLERRTPFIAHDEQDVNERMSGFSQYNSDNRAPLFVPGGSAMWILVPWKPVVLVCLLGPAARKSS
jgi:hypothetical protein